MKNTAANDHTSFSLVRFIFSKWKILTLVCLIAAIASFVAASLIRPHFRATAVIFAPRTNSVSKILLADETNNERMDIKAYAVEEGTEQMMELLGSREIKDALIKKFDLLAHYDLDTNTRYWQTKIYKSLQENLTIKRTKYGAIAISFEDYDPQLTYAVTNEVLLLIDSLKRGMENERATAAYHALQQQLTNVETEIQRLDDSIKLIMQHGVYDLESQSERIMQQYAIAVAQGNTAAQQRLQTELEKLSLYGPQSEALRDLQFNFRKYHSLVKQKMLDAQVDMENTIPTKFIVERPIVPDKKVYPKKSIVMTLSIVGSLIITLFLLLIIENVKAAPEARREE